jgi:hypothetical protein
MTLTLLGLVAWSVVGQCSTGDCATLPTTRLVSVEVASGNGIGSGTIVRATRERSLVLTAAHMLRNRDRRILARALDGQWYAGRFLGRAAGADLAAFEIATPRVIYSRILQEYPAFRTGRTWDIEIAPRVASRIVMYGYGGENGRGLRLRSGSFLESLGAELAYSMQPQLGDSGGGAWSPDGYFLGVLTARDGRYQETSSRAYIVAPSVVRRFLAEECCLLRLVGIALLGRRDSGRDAFSIRSSETTTIDPPVTTRVIAPPEAGTMVAEQPMPRPQLREATPPEAVQLPADRARIIDGNQLRTFEATPDTSVLPFPVENSVVVFQNNAAKATVNPLEIAQMRADIADMRAKMNLGITFAIPQLNGLQKRRTVRLGEVMGLEMNSQGPAMEAAPTAAPNQ